MTRIFSGARALVLLLVLPIVSLSPGHAGEQVCTGWGNCPPFTYVLSSSSDRRAYGVLLSVPKESTCEVVRFRVRGALDKTLGTTPPLMPGQLAVLRMGSGFASGNHALRIEASGCALHPAEARRVTLGRLSHDHSWRAAAILATRPVAGSEQR